MIADLARIHLDMHTLMRKDTTMSKLGRVHLDLTASKSGDRQELHDMFAYLGEIVGDLDRWAESTTPELAVKVRATNDAMRQLRETVYEILQAGRG